MLMKNSGFGRDPDTGGPTTCDSVWKAVIAAQKEAAMYRERIFSQYEECTYIFTGQGAMGKYAKYILAHLMFTVTKGFSILWRNNRVDVSSIQSTNTIVKVRRELARVRYF